MTGGWVARQPSRAQARCEAANSSDSAVCWGVLLEKGKWRGRACRQIYIGVVDDTGPLDDRPEGSEVCC